MTFSRERGRLARLLCGPEARAPRERGFRVRFRTAFSERIPQETPFFSTFYPPGTFLAFPRSVSIE